MSIAALAPLLVVAVAGTCGLCLRRSPRALERVALVSAVAQVGAAAWLVASVAQHGILRVQLGGWPSPHAISLVGDRFASLMVAVAALVALASTLSALHAGWGDRTDPAAVSAGLIGPAGQFLMLGVYGAFLTGDLFNLYVWFEVLLLASFVLLVGVPAANRDEAEHWSAGLRYVAANLLSSILFLTALALVYGAAGSLDYGELRWRMAEVSAARPELALLIGTLLTAAFLVKAAVFPAHLWLPAGYPIATPAVAALFAGLLTKVGIASLYRVLPALFGQQEALFTGLLWLSFPTVLVGVIGAVAQTEIRRILSFHVVSQVGYMVLALGLVSVDRTLGVVALAAGVFYVAHHILVKAGLFLVGGAVEALRGTDRLSRARGLLGSAPWLAVLFAVPAASLAGLPPLSGFWAKLAVVRAALEAGAWVAVTVAMLGGVLTLVSMLKIWTEAFWTPADEPADEPGESPPTARQAWLLAIPIAILAIGTVAIGLAPGPLAAWSEAAARELWGVAEVRPWEVRP